MMYLEPTGRCFSYATEWAGKHGGVVVHADVLFPRSVVARVENLRGKRLAHAWVEFDGLVRDHQGQGKKPVSVSDFYAEFDPTNVQRYPKMEALELAIFTRNWGPWTEAEKEAHRESKIKATKGRRR